MSLQSPRTPATSRLRVEGVDPFSGDRWDAAVEAYPEHGVFHLSAWARVLVEAYGHRPHYLRVSEDGEEVALVPLLEVRSLLTGARAVSLPFSDYAGPLVRDRVDEALVLHALVESSSSAGWKHLELRAQPFSRADLPAHRRYLGHELDLRPGLEAVEAGYDPATRRAIRKADKEGVEVSMETSSTALDSFYQLHRRTRRRHGLPPQPLRFFRAIHRHLIHAGHGIVALARVSKQIIAGAVFLRSGTRAIYKFGASDTEHWSLRPNQAIMAGAIRHLLEAGHRHLHFGRTDAPDQGLARFKASWGARVHELRYHRYLFSSGSWLAPESGHAGSHPALFGHLPLSLNQLAGSLIYPHLD